MLDWGSWLFIMFIFGAFVGLATPVLGGAFVLYLHLRRDKDPNWKAILIVLSLTLVILLIASIRCFTEITPWAN